MVLGGGSLGDIFKGIFKDFSAKVQDHFYSPLTKFRMTYFTLASLCKFSFTSGER